MIYEFFCEACNSTIETDEFSMSNCPREIDCPVCKNGKARKIMSVPSKPGAIFYNVPDVPSENKE
jgi:putative FmdB family regulatory protein